MTPKTLADALGCFWNAAMGAAHARQDFTATSVATVMVEGVAAVAARLEEHDAGESRRISELLAANNRYQQEARDARAVVARYHDALSKIGDLGSALRQSGPAPEDLQDLSAALETAVNLAHEAISK